MIPLLSSSILVMSMLVFSERELGCVPTPGVVDESGKENNEEEERDPEFVTRS